MSSEQATQAHMWATSSPRVKVCVAFAVVSVGPKELVGSSVEESRVLFLKFRSSSFVPGFL